MCTTKSCWIRGKNVFDSTKLLILKGRDADKFLWSWVQWELITMDLHCILISFSKFRSFFLYDLPLYFVVLFQLRQTAALQAALVITLDLWSAHLEAVYLVEVVLKSALEQWRDDTRMVHMSLQHQHLKGDLHCSCEKKFLRKIFWYVVKLCCYIPCVWDWKTVVVPCSRIIQQKVNMNL